VNLNWKKQEDDLYTPKLCLNEIANFFMDKDIGRIGIFDFVINKTNYPEDDEIGGHHHMGGTRMGDGSNKYDVVDRNLKVFNTQNLYIAGSSVFRTGGHANPTLTITQLSLRLAEHLSNI
jgi:choline dehydrogenase-like flavoprotein